MDIDQIIRETGVDGDAIRVLVDPGLEMEQLVALLKDPTTALSCSTEFETSENVVIDEDGAISLLTSDDGGIRPLSSGRQYCGWADTKHDGSTWAIRCARLNLRTDWCWDDHAVLSHTIQHASRPPSTGPPPDGGSTPRQKDPWAGSPPLSGSAPR